VETEDLWLEKAINSVYRGDFQLLLPVSTKAIERGNKKKVLTREKFFFTVFIPKIYMIKTTNISTAQPLNRI
jgi:hypothetical protein